MSTAQRLITNNVAFIGTFLVTLYMVSTTPLSPELSKHWENFKNEHQKQYEKKEESVRLGIFANNLQRINQHNKEAEQGLHTYTMKISKFTDMTQQEMVEHMSSVYVDMKPPKNEFHLECGNDLPEEVDLRKLDMVTYVRNQLSCGSCYTFSAVGAIEALYKKMLNKTVILSEQNILDCSVKEGNAKCAGGWPYLAFQYVIDNKGIENRKSYPYEGYNQTCKFDRSRVEAKISSYVNLTSGSECELKKALANLTAVAIVIDSNHTSLGFYGSGVYYEPECVSDYFTHALLVVGYGTDKKHGDYWLIKNSWGTGWGEGGFIRMARNRGNNCGVASLPCYPVL